MTELVADLLIEIGTEELPPGSLRKLAQAFANEVAAGLTTAGLSIGESHVYATPRRLAVTIQDIPTQQPARLTKRRGPAWSAAFDAAGKPTRALEGFAHSTGLSIEAMERVETEKGAWVLACIHEPGRPTLDLLPQLASTALDRLPMGKRMRWGSGKIQFVRPVHWIVFLFGETLVDTTLLGIRAGRETRGHRVHHPAPICIHEPLSYASILESEGRILADFNERRTAIKVQVESLSAELGGRAMLDENLLDEVTALVEWPVALAGTFNPRFLDVPHEALITTMVDNQRYFPVLDADGALMARFITIANLESRHPEIVRDGNERVIRPRLQDAEFFWQQDCRQPLIDYRPKLHDLVFQKQLGTIYEKTERLAHLTSLIAEQLGAEAEEGKRAGELSKCDLVTSMVFEFPELEGVMGRYYALHSGESKAVAQALEDQYRPAHVGDEPPAGSIGQALSLADKLDSLTGIFAIGQRPSGTKDPFALRRAALGIVHILIECSLDLDLQELLERAAASWSTRLKHAELITGEVFDYIMDRLTAYYAELGITADVVEAVLACRPTCLYDLDQRVQAVQRFRSLPEAESLAAANKRIRNLLKQAGKDISIEIDTEILLEPTEQALYGVLLAAEADTESLFNQGYYTQALTRLATLKDPVDTFFDETMVMTEDPRLRQNRIALLARLAKLFLRTADLSRLQP